jgi:hypothetical protein
MENKKRALARPSLRGAKRQGAQRAPAIQTGICFTGLLRPAIAALAMTGCLLNLSAVAKSGCFFK